MYDNRRRLRPREAQPKDAGGEDDFRAEEHDWVVDAGVQRDQEGNDGQNQDRYHAKSLTHQLCRP